METFLAQFETLPQYLGGHLLLSGLALTIGIALSVPLGIWVTRSNRREQLVMGAVGGVQTVPSLALLALMVPLLGGLIGIIPALIALTLYSMLPIVQNTVTGIQGVDAGLMEAARGMGMTSRQLLFKVQLPLASPVIIAGIKVATIWVFGTATLATPVGADSLGYYIFMGLNTRNDAVTLFGCLVAMAVALLLYKLIGAIQASVEARRRARTMVLSAITATIFIIGMAVPLTSTLMRHSGTSTIADTNGDTVDAGLAVPGKPLAGLRLRVGGKNFTESYLLSNLLAIHLRSQGADVELSTGMGSKVLFDATRAGSIDLYVDYSGTIWATLMKRRETKLPQQTLIEVSDYLLKEHGIVSVGRLGFENAYAFAMRRDRADQLGIRSITDLSEHAPDLKIAGDFDFFGRAEGKLVLQAYDLEFRQRRNMNSRLMYDAIAGGQVDVVTAYTTDGQILAFDLLVLDDPRAAFPPYDAILLLSPDAGRNPQVVDSVKVLVNSIRDDDMRWANKSIDLDQRAVAEVAQELYDRIKSRMLF